METVDEFWPDVGPNSGWLGGTGESWERGPYFVDGLLPLAWQLDDPVLKAKAMRFVNWTLDHQAATLPAMGISAGAGDLLARGALRPVGSASRARPGCPFGTAQVS